VEQLHKSFEEFYKTITKVVSEPDVRSKGSTPLRNDPTISQVVKGDKNSLMKASNDLLLYINEKLSNRIYAARRDHRSSVIIVLSTSICGVLLLSSLLGFFYAWLFHPIRDLERGAGQIAKGDFDHYIEVHSGDEMEDLAAAFNHMTDRLREMYRDL